MSPGSPPGKPLCLLLLLLILPGSGAAGQAAHEAMADAMAGMMEAMGLFDSAPGQRRLDGGAPWGRAFGTPWPGPVQDQSRSLPMRELMHQFAGQMLPPNENNGGWSPTWEPSRLEGVWEGRDGELLIIQGERFRIYSPEVRRVDGLIRIRGDRLALYNPLDRHAQPFEFAEHQGRLILRSLAGQLYLYRRLQLDDGWALAGR